MKQIQFISAKEAAELLGVSKQRIIHLINEGRINAERVGNAWVLLKSEVERFEPNRPGRPSK